MLKAIQFVAPDRLLRFLAGILGLVWLSATSAHALTAANIIDRSRTYMRDVSNDSARQRYSDQQLLDFINDGQREANGFAWLMKSSITFQLQGGTTEYSLPSDFMATWRVELQLRRLEQTSMNQEDANSIGWRSSRGPPQRYYLYTSTSPWIGFVPAPTITSTGTVTIYYIQQTQDMTSTSQTPFSGWVQLTPYHSALAYYVAYRALWTIGDTDLAERYYAEWAAWIEVMRTGMAKMPDFNPGLQGRRE